VIASPWFSESVTNQFGTFIRYNNKKEISMANHVYKKLELVGSSTIGIEDAVQNAVAKASRTIRNMSWFEVVETRGHIENDKIAYWQVTIKVGFNVED